MYGFRRVAKGEDQGAYFHPKFQRGRKDMVSEIKRLPAKSTLPSLEDVMNAQQQQLPAVRSNATKKKATPPPHHETPVEIKKAPVVVPVPEIPGVRRAARLRKYNEVDTTAATIENEHVAKKARPTSPSHSYGSAHTTDGASSMGDSKYDQAVVKPTSKSKNTTNNSKGSPVHHHQHLQSPVPYPISVADVPGKCDYLDLPLGSPLFSSDLLIDTTVPAPTRIYPSDFDCLTVSDGNQAADYSLVSPTSVVPTYADMHRKFGPGAGVHFNCATTDLSSATHMSVGGMGNVGAAALSVNSERWVPHADAIDELLDFLSPLPGAQDLLFQCEDASDGGGELCAVREEVVKA